MRLSIVTRMVLDPSSPNHRYCGYFERSSSLALLSSLGSPTKDAFPCTRRYESLLQSSEYVSMMNATRGFLSMFLTLASRRPDLGFASIAE